MLALGGETIGRVRKYNLELGEGRRPTTSGLTAPQAATVLILGRNPSAVAEVSNNLCSEGKGSGVPGGLQISPATTRLLTLTLLFFGVMPFFVTNHNQTKDRGRAIQEL